MGVGLSKLDDRPEFIKGRKVRTPTPRSTRVKLFRVTPGGSNPRGANSDDVRASGSETAKSL